MDYIDQSMYSELYGYLTKTIGSTYPLMEVQAGTTVVIPVQVNSKSNQLVVDDYEYMEGYYMNGVYVPPFYYQTLMKNRLPDTTQLAGFPGNVYSSRSFYLPVMINNPVPVEGDYAGDESVNLAFVDCSPVM